MVAEGLEGKGEVTQKAQLRCFAEMSVAGGLEGKVMGVTGQGAQLGDALLGWDDQGRAKEEGDRRKLGWRRS